MTYLRMSWFGASFLFVFALVLGLCPQELFSAEKFVCILGGTGTRHGIPVLAAAFGLYPKYGLNATIVRIGSGTVATAALLGGRGGCDQYVRTGFDQCPALRNAGFIR